MLLPLLALYNVRLGNFFISRSKFSRASGPSLYSGVFIRGLPLEHDKPNSFWPLAILGAVVSMLALFTSKRNQPSESMHPPNTTEHENGRTPSATPAVGLNKMPPPTHPTCSSQCRYPEEKWWKDWAEGIAILIALGLLIANIIQTCAVRNQLGEMQKQTTIQRETSVNSERAWIGLNGSVVTDVLEATPKVKIGGHYSIENFGHGPALKVFPNSMPVWEYERADYRKTAEMVCVPAIEFATGTVPFGPGVSNPGPMGYTLFPGQIHEEQIGGGPWEGDGLAKPMRHFWFIGCVAYLDQFKAVHWTRFCIESSFTHQPINKDTPLRFCSLYNDAGDWEPK